MALIHQSGLSVFAYSRTSKLLNHVAPQNTWIPHKTTSTSSRFKPSSKTIIPAYKSLCNDIHNIVTTEEEDDVKHSTLVKQVRTLIAKVNDERFDDLLMVDSLQRLGIDYHFVDEINTILKRRYAQFSNTDVFDYQNLYEVSLCFRILRQNGFHVSSEAFMKFKGQDHKFEEKLNDDIKGLMELYEASHLGMKGEIILDEAQIYSCQRLEDSIKFLDDKQAKMVQRTLNNPYYKTVPFLNFKNYIDDFDNTALQQLAELEFYKAQTLHQRELNTVIRWWNELGVVQELPLARNQPLFMYIAPMVSLTNPNLSSQRINMAKIASLICIIDDIFDLYGTIDELTLLTEAVSRWDMNVIDSLPNYMKTSFKALDDVINEISNEVYEQHGLNPINSLRKSWQTYIDAFLEEAKLIKSGRLLTTKEYLEIGIATSGVHTLLSPVFFLLGDGKTEEHVQIIENESDIITLVSKMFRLYDDLATTEEESLIGRGSYIKYYLNENEGCSIEDAHEHVLNLISDTWKCLNKECFSPNPFSDASIRTTNNLARMLSYMSSYGDTGSLALLSDYLKALVVHEASDFESLGS
ncbi:(3S,6E)-nerolidol synthase 1-like [Rutidosis leptorrhynchoides]|uniref:(3S,6E)-nerolidol synthase 1-like n=1 Tax=Rutidosis leptorrhynchoides TaxID=125765 RepID=UPI003A9991C7